MNTADCVTDRDFDLNIAQQNCRAQNDTGHQGCAPCAPYFPVYAITTIQSFSQRAIP